MTAADIFVILRYCQFEKNNYQNRFFADGKWWTMRVSKKTERILDKRYLHRAEDWAKITKKYPVLKKVEPIIESDLSWMNDYSSLWKWNTHIIDVARELLGIKTKCLLDGETGLKGTDRLRFICQKFNADTYLSGPSGRNYLELDKFEKAGIKVEFFEPTDKRPLCELL